MNSLRIGVGDSSRRLDFLCVFLSHSDIDTTVCGYPPQNTRVMDVASRGFCQFSLETAVGSVFMLCLASKYRVRRMGQAQSESQSCESIVI